MKLSFNDKLCCFLSVLGVVVGGANANRKVIYVKMCERTDCGLLKYFHTALLSIIVLLVHFFRCKDFTNSKSWDSHSHVPIRFLFKNSIAYHGEK